MGKSKNKSLDATNGDESIIQEDDSQLDKSKVSWEERTKYLSPISVPLASKKLTRKLYKVIKKAKDNKALRKGIKEVQKSLRKGEKGMVVIAGDVSPMDIVTHIPVVCEESSIPYCFTPSKAELGQAYGSKRQACMVFVLENSDMKEDIQECKAKISEIPLPY